MSPSRSAREYFDDVRLRCLCVGVCLTAELRWTVATATERPDDIDNGLARKFDNVEYVERDRSPEDAGYRTKV